MTSKIVLASGLILAGMTGANAGMEFRPFVGAHMGMQQARYTDSMKQLERATATDLPTDFFAFGVDAGFRRGCCDGIYQGGITVSATKTTYSDAQEKYTDDRVASIDMLNLSATYDNYIRISGDKANRIDLVLGAGAGAMVTHFNIVDGSVWGQDDYHRWSFAPEVKAGMDFALTHNVTLSATARMFIPTRSHYEIDTSYILGGGVKYLF